MRILKILQGILHRMIRFVRRHLWPSVFGVFLLVYFVFTLLYAFVIPHGVVAMEAADDVEIEKEEPVSIHPLTEEEEEEAAAEAAADKPQTTRTSYESRNISIQISEFQAYDTDIYAADVIVQDPELLKSGLAEGEFGRNVNENTSRIAEENDAILAINGDHYGLRDDGFVLRNGYLYRSEKRADADSEDLVIYQDGSMEIVREKITDIQTLISNGATQIFSYGPGLVVDEEITVDENPKNARAGNSNPRTAIGYIPPKETEPEESEEEESEEASEEESEAETGGETTEEEEEEQEPEYETGTHYLFLVADGRTSQSVGLTLYELAEVMQELGCTQAYNLDGGGATTMYFNGQVVNNPTGGIKKGEQGVSDIVYIQK